MQYIILVLGFILLIKGADFFVEGSSSIARRLGIPTLVIGLTLVAFGTSAPEAAVSITSALQGKNEMAIGNVVGSNIFNLLVVVGVAAFICPLKVKQSIIYKEFPFVLLSGVLLLVLVWDTKLQDVMSNILTRSDGLVLLMLFCIFMYYLIEVALQSRQAKKAQVSNRRDSAQDTLSYSKSSILTLVGILGIILGGKFVVDAASTIALSWGMSQNLVGLTIVAIGTSLPELVTSMAAARQGQSDIALGNVIGSNIFNVFFILGISVVVHPIAIDQNIFVDSLILLGVSIMTYVFAITKKSINRVEGVFLVACYMAYLMFVILRN